MNFFDDLNPYLVRQEDTTPPSSNTGPSFPPENPPNPGFTPPPVVTQAYIENVLRINIGKLGTFYFTYTGSNEWRDKMYKGVIEQVGRDHFVIHDPKTDQRYLLQLVYFNWAEFDEQLNSRY